ncbi:MAG TPA: hypothetical protein ENI48_10375 [Thioploca sp.]|nr:hypothetical protein [Thioploca sp.]
MLKKKRQLSLLFALLLGWLPQAYAVDFNLTMATSGNGTVISAPTGINCGDDCTEPYAENTAVKLTAFPNTGSKFTGWSGNCSGTSNSTYVIMTEDKTCTARFELLPTPSYDLTVIKTAHGTVTSTDKGINCGSDCTEQYEEGISVILIADPDADSSFNGWGGDCGGSKALTLTVTLDTAKTCTATFKLLPVELTVNKIGNGSGNVTSNPAGINCGITCAASFDVGTTIILSAAPDDDSEFVDWTGDCTASDDPPTEATVTMDNAAITCTANFKPLPHTLRVTTIGGNGTVTGSHGGINCGDKCSAPLEEGTVVTLTAAPDVDYAFTGWTSDCEGTDKSATVTMDADKLCVAHFQRLAQTLTVKTFDNGNVTSSPTGIDCGIECVADHDYDSFVKLTAQPDVGYQFTGWHGDCVGIASSSTVKMDGAKTCKAYFAELPPDDHSNLTVVTMGGNGIVTSDPDGFSCDTICTAPYENDFTLILTATPDADSSFESWGEDCAGTDNLTTVTLNDLSLTCTANFKLLPPTYNLMITKTGTGGGVITSDLLGVEQFGINCGADCIAAYPQNTEVTLTVTPDFGSNFIGWSRHCSGVDSSTTVILDAAKTCTAIFELQPTYDLNLTYGGSGSGTVTSNVQGINCGANCTKYPKNAEITLTAIPEINSTFLNWGVDCTGVGNPITLTLDKAKSCTANFNVLPSYDVTVTKTGDGSGKIERNPGGDNCGKDCQRHYQGTNVTLTATAYTGSKFTGWGGDCTGIGSPLTVSINEARTCTANFTETPTYGLTVEFAGGGHGSVNNKLAASSDQGTQCTVNCTTIYYESERVALTATPEADSSFVGWSGDCAGTGTSTTVTMNSVKTCTASFELLPPATLTVTKTGDGTGTVKADLPAQINCGESCSEEYAANTVVVLTAVADDDSTFTGWSGNCSSTESTITITMDVSKTCTASFSRLAPPGSHHLTVTKTENGSVTSSPTGINCGATCTTHYPEGTVITLTASPDAGFTFTRWSGNCSSISNSVVVEMNATQICMAHFAQIPPAGNHNLTVIKTGNGTVVSAPSGINCGTICTAAYSEGTSVTLNATPDTFARFIGWDGNCTGTNSVATVAVNATKNCFAHFEWIPSSVQFSAVTYEVNEVVGTAILSVTRAGSPVGAVSVDYTTADGSALAGSDYVAVTGTLSWDEGDTRLQKIAIPLLLDGETEDKETLSVSLSNVSSGAELGSNTQATLTIVDTPTSGASILQFSAINYAANENSGTATISVNRLGGKSGQVTIAYATSDDTAIAGSDYQTTQGTLKWASGDAQTKTFTVPVIDDTKPETNETVTLILSNPTGNAQLGVNKTATLNLIDSLGTPDTTTLSGVLQFTESNYQAANEEVGSVTLMVSRTHGSHGEVTVSYTTQEGTAKADQDYLETTGALNWGEGDTDNKEIIVSIMSDTVEEANETFTVNLSNPTSDASLGTIPTATVNILDSFGTPDTTIPSDSPGFLQFAADNYQVAENGGSITITVTRTGGSVGVVEATYTTADDTATSRDYIATRNTLRWQDRDSEAKSFKISLYDDGLIEGDENSLLKLFNPTEGAILGSNAEAIVMITDDDATWVQFSSNTYVVDEDSNIATITVSRVGGRIGEVSVEYDLIEDCSSSIDNCATVDEDYTVVNLDKHVLTWISGDGYDKTFTIFLHDDNDVEGNEVLPLKLFNLKGNASLGTPIETMLTIVDNDTGECAPPPVKNCYWENDGNTLQDVIITPLGTVVGGELTGKIENQGVVQDVTLLANTLIYGGGIVRGDIRGVPEGPAILSNVEVAANSTLAYVIIASGTLVDSSVILKEGVLFEYNSLIPYRADLNKTLGHISTVGLDIDAIKLTSDVLLNTGSDGILGAINGLYEFASLKMALRQEPSSGYLLLDVESIHHAVLPVQVRQIWGRQTIENQPLKPLGLTVDPNGEVTFITHTGREVVTLPVVQNPLAFREALNSTFGLDKMSLQSSGNLKIPAPEGAYYMARPNLFSTDAPAGTPVGIDMSKSLWLNNVADVFLVFEVDDGQVQLPETTFPVVGSGGTGGTGQSTGSPIQRLQLMYPAAANPEALYALSERSDSRPALYNDGRVYAYTGSGVSKKPYKGVLDYLVTPGTPTGRSYAQINEIEDVNGDGFNDYRIVYPNGDSQVMYQCAVCFE